MRAANDLRGLAAVLLLLLLVATSTCSAKPLAVYDGLENTNIDRTVSLTDHLEEVTLDIEVENKGDLASSYYLLTIPPAKAQHLSFLQASMDKRELPTRRVEVDASAFPELEEGTLFYRVSFRTSLQPGDGTSFEVKAVYTHTQVPLPASITQSEDQKVIWSDNHYVHSPYSSVRQMTKIRLASSTVVSRSRSVKPTSKDDAELSYGPYKNVAPLSFEELTVHFKNNEPFITFRKMIKNVEVSHWGNVEIFEHYEMKHTGATLKGSFSRVAYDRGITGASFNRISANLPRGSRDVYYRDRIGNISTSSVRDEGRRVHFEISPRYPVFGGWAAAFTTGYSVPAHHILSVDADHPTTHVLKVAISTNFEEAVVDDLEFRAILPEGATNIRFTAPFPIEDWSFEEYFTNLDTTPRPVLVLKRENLVHYHQAEVTILYDYEMSNMLREPLLLSGIFFTVFCIGMIVVRVDLSISVPHAKHSRSRKSASKGAKSSSTADVDRNAVHQKLLGAYHAFHKDTSAQHKKRLFSILNSDEAVAAFGEGKVAQVTKALQHAEHEVRASSGGEKQAWLKAETLLEKLGN